MEPTDSFFGILDKLVAQRCDPILIAFDVGGRSSRGFTDIGVSFLDSRLLTTHDAVNGSIPSIVTYHYLKRGRNESRRYRRAKRLSRFSEPWFIAQADMLSLLAHIFCYDDSTTKSQVFSPFTLGTGSNYINTPPLSVQMVNRRPLILVGHDIQNDIQAVERTGFTINHYAPVDAILDTQDIARELFGGTKTLGDLCQHLRIKAKNLHNSGNDATYTLLALLKMGATVLGERGGGDCGIPELMQNVVNTCLQNTEQNPMWQRYARCKTLDGGNVLDE